MPGNVRRRIPMAATAGLFLSGCATTAIDENFKSAQAFAQQRLGAEVRWLTTEEVRRRTQDEVDALLSKPLGADDAVRIALASNPAVQATLFEGAAASATATQSARLPNPVFTFERLLRNEAGLRELELTRMLAISLYDLILLPSRMRLAGYQQEQIRLKLAAQVVQAAVEARQAWVRAVAAQQAVHYFGQVKAAADASAELARRMQAVGNFSKLQRAREQAFAAEAVAQYARAQQAARSAREALVRALGLGETQTAALTLPERLPDLPRVPVDEASVFQAARDQRLDVRIARANLELTAQEQGLTRITSLVSSFHIAGVSKSETDRSLQKGYEIEVPLPLFDFGDAGRARAEAAYMAALNRTAQVIVDADSQVRESYSAYRTADDLARHYRDEIVPLRKTIAEENLLRYNGMLIGVFELLADAREQIASVVQAIEAQRDFWLADAALQAAMIGQPMSGPVLRAGSGAPAAGGAERH